MRAVMKVRKGNGGLAAVGGWQNADLAALLGGR